MMKKYTKTVIMLLVLSALCGCSEKPWVKDIVLRSADSIRGYYAISSVIWHGEPIDVDNDNETETELIDALGSLSNGRLDGIYYASVSNVDYRFLDNSNRIFFKMPVAMMMLDENGAYTVPAGALDLCYLNASYSIDENGTISIGEVMHDQYMWDVPLIEYISDGTLVQTGYAEMELTLNYPFYDYRTGQVLCGMATFHFVRSEYR